MTIPLRFLRAVLVLEKPRSGIEAFNVWRSRDQTMAAGEEGDQQLFNHLLLAHDDLRELGRDFGAA